MADRRDGGRWSVVSLAIDKWPPTIDNFAMPDFLAERFLLTTLIALLLLVAIAWLAGRVHTVQRSRELLAALDDSTRGKVKPAQGPGAAGFRGAIEPPPEPFVHFAVDYRARARFDVLGMLLGPLTPRTDLLVLTARLPTHPVAELVWAAGQVPARALARRERASLWVLRRLDIVDAEYAVRGANTGAIEHVFLDLQARFRPFLQRISVQGDDDPEVHVVLRVSRMNLREVPALMASLRTLGKAALRD